MAVGVGAAITVEENGPGEEGGQVSESWKTEGFCVRVSVRGVDIEDLIQQG